MALNLGDLFFRLGADTSRLIEAENALRRTAQTAEVAAQRANAAATAATTGTAAAAKSAAAALNQMSTATSASVGPANALAGGFRLLTSAFGAFSAVLVVRKIAEYADAAKSLESQLRLVTSSTTELTQVQDALFQVAQQTRQGFEATAETYTKLAQSARSSGFSQQELLEITEAVNLAFLKGGASAATAELGIRQLGQAFARGKLGGDEFISVSENATTILLALEKQLGKTRGELLEMSSAGELTDRVIGQALIASLDDLRGSAEKVEVTLGQAFTQVNNALLLYVGNVDQATSASKGLATAISGLAGFLEQAAQGAKLLGEDLARALGQAQIARLREVNEEIQRLQTQAETGTGAGVLDTLLGKTDPRILQATLADLRAEQQRLQQALTHTGEAATQAGDALKSSLTPEQVKAQEEAQKLVDRLTEQAAKLGLNATQLAEYERAQALANGATQEQADTIAAATLKISQYGESQKAAKAATSEAAREATQHAEALKEVHDAARAHIDVLENQSAMLAQVGTGALSYEEALHKMAVAETAATVKSQELAEQTVSLEEKIKNQTAALQANAARWEEANHVWQQARATQSDLLTSFDEQTASLNTQHGLMQQAITGARAYDDVLRDLAIHHKELELRANGAVDGLRGVNDTVKQMATELVDAERSVENTTASFEKLNEFTFNLGEEVAQGMRQVVTGILQGTREAEDILAAFGDIGVGIFADMFARTIEEKLSWEATLSGNLLNDLPNLFGLSGLLSGSGFLDSLGGSLQGASGIVNNAATTLGDLSQVTWTQVGSQSGVSYGGGLIAGLSGYMLGEGARALFAIGQSTEGAIGAGIGAALGGIGGFILGGPAGAAIGSALGDLFGGFLGDLFAHTPTLGTQIRKGVVEWLDEIEVSFADAIDSGDYFFEESKKLADKMFGGDFLAASKQVLEDKAGPELAKQLQALGTFITADQAFDLGKSVEQTGTTFGNLLIDNLGLEAIPEALDEIIAKSGITFADVIDKLNVLVQQGAVSWDFYNDAVTGAVDLFTGDLPSAINVSAIAMQSFTDDGIFSLTVFQEKLEQAVSNFKLIGEAFGSQIISGLESGLDVDAAGAAFEQFMRQAIAKAAIAKLVAEELDPILANLDLSQPLSPDVLEMLRTEFDRLYGLSLDIWDAWIGVADTTQEVADTVSNIGLRDEIGKSGEAFEEMTEEAKKWAEELLDAQEKLTGLQSGFTIPEVNKLAAAAQDFEDQLRSSISAGVTDGIVEGILAGKDFDPAALTQTLQLNVYTAVITGIIDALIQSAIITPIINQAMAPFTAAITTAMADGVISAAELTVLLTAGKDAIAQIPGLINTGMQIVTGVLNSPEFQQLQDDLRDLVGGTVSVSVPSGGGVSAGGGGGGGGGVSGSTALTEDPLEDFRTALQDLQDAIADFTKEVGQSLADDLMNSLADVRQEAAALVAELGQIQAQSPASGAAVSIDTLLRGFNAELSDLITLLNRRPGDDIAALTLSLADFADLDALFASIADPTVLRTVQQFARELQRALAPLGISLEDFAGQIGDIEAAAAAQEAAIIDDFMDQVEAFSGSTSELSGIVDEYQALVDGVNQNAEAIAAAGYDVNATLAGLTAGLVEQVQAQVSEFGGSTDELSSIVDEYNSLVEAIAETSAALVAAGVDVEQAYADLAAGLVEQIQEQVGDFTGSTDELSEIANEYQGLVDGINANAAALAAAGYDVDQALADLATALQDKIQAQIEDQVSSFVGSTDELSSIVSEYNSLVDSINANTALLVGAGVDVEQVLADLAAALQEQIQAMGDALLEPIDAALADLLDTPAPDLSHFLPQISSAETFEDLERLSAEATDAIVSNYERQRDAAIEASEAQIDALEEIRDATIESLREEITNYNRLIQLREELIRQEIAAIDVEIAAINERQRLEEEAARAREQDFDRLIQLRTQLIQQEIAAVDIEIAAIDERQRLREEEARTQEQNFDRLIQLREQVIQEEIQGIEDQIDILEDQRQAIEDTREAAEKLLDASRSIREQLADLRAGEESLLLPQQRLDLLTTQFQEALAAGQGGDVEAAARAQELGAELIGLGQELFASGQPAQDIFALVTGGLEGLADILEQTGTAQLSLADRQEAALDAQIEALDIQKGILESQLLQEDIQAEIRDLNRSLGLTGTESLDTLNTMRDNVQVQLDTAIAQFDLQRTGLERQKEQLESQLLSEDIQKEIRELTKSLGLTGTESLDTLNTMKGNIKVQLDKQIAQFDLQRTGLERQKEQLESQLNSEDIQAEIRELERELNVTSAASLGTLREMRDHTQDTLDLFESGNDPISQAIAAEQAALENKLEALKNAAAADLLLLRQETIGKFNELIGPTGLAYTNARLWDISVGIGVVYGTLLTGFGSVVTALAATGTALSNGGTSADSALLTPTPLQHGGIATRPMLAMIGEGGQDEAVLPLPAGWRTQTNDELIQEVKALRAETQKVRELLAQEGFTFNFYGESKEAIAKYTMDKIRRRITYGDIGVRFKGERGTFVWEG